MLSKYCRVGTVCTIIEEGKVVKQVVVQCDRPRGEGGPEGNGMACAAWAWAGLWCIYSYQGLCSTSFVTRYDTIQV